MKWIFLGIILFLTVGIGLAVYYSTHPVPVFEPRATMFVNYGNGKTEVVKIPAPDRYLRNGLAHVPDYAAKLVQSKSPKASLIITSRDKNESCLVLRMDGRLIVMESIEIAPPSRAQPEHEKAVRKLFKELGIDPESDNVHDYNGVQDAMRDLSYPLPDDQKRVSLVITRFLAEVDKINESESLDFTYQEN